MHLVSNWGSVRVAHVEATGVGDTPEIGSTIDLRAEVELPGLVPGDVEVQAAYGRVDDADGLHEVTAVPMAHEGTEGSRHWFTATIRSSAPGPSATRCGCCPPRPRWPPRPSSASSPPPEARGWTVGAPTVQPPLLRPHPPGRRRRRMTRGCGIGDWW